MAAVARADPVRGGLPEVRETRDRAVLRGFLERDRLFAAYALCDLDEREFPRTRWGVAFDGGQVVAVCMEYGGLSPQPLFVMGEPDSVSAILSEVIRTRAAYLAAPIGLLPAVARHYEVDPGPLMSRMWVDRASFRPHRGDVVRLGTGDVGDLNRLYELGLTSWLPSESVAEGVYYGVRRGGRLVAAAGTHVISRDMGLAAVGNVFTHRDFRGRGLAKAVTSAVTEKLLGTVRQVVLNVRTDNPPALAAYAALGYAEHVRFEERLIHRRGSIWDSILTPIRRRLMVRRSDR
jgi:ribosomal protein S18 acetylase RimI-like enzyme